MTSAAIRTGDAELNVSDAEISHFAAPVAAARYTGRVSCKSGLFRCPPGIAGSVAVEGQGRYASESDYQTAGTFTGTGDVPKLRGVRISGSFDAQPRVALLRSIRVNALGGSVTADVTIRDLESYTARGKVARIDLAHAAALETPRTLPYDGLISGSFEAAGRLANFSRGPATAGAQLEIAPALKGPAARGAIAVRYKAGQSIELGNSWLEAPHSRIDASGTLGSRLAVKAESQDIHDLLPALPAIDIAFDDATFEGTVTGPLDNPKIAGHATTRRLVYQGRQLDAAAGEIAVSSDLAAVRDGSVSLGEIQARIGGSIALKDWQTTPASSIAANVDLRNADIAKVAALAGYKQIPVTGTFSGTGQISGTLGSPLANADVGLSHGAIENQPFDSITGKLELVDRNTQSLTGLFVSGPKRVNIGARFRREGAQFPAGALEFNLTSNTMPLNQIALVRARQPDILGFGKFHADGTLRISHDAGQDVQYRLETLNADGSANSLELGGRNLGDARFTSQTKDGVVQTHFESNAAKAVIRGDGTVKLSGDYPMTAHVTFGNVGLNALAALIVKEEDAPNLNFDGEAAGRGDRCRARAEHRPMDGDVGHSEVSRFVRCPAATSRSPPRSSSFTTDGPCACLWRNRNFASRALISKRRKPTSTSTARWRSGKTLRSICGCAATSIWRSPAPSTKT